MKPIRERPEDIPKLCAVYLNSLSLSMANQIVGLEPEALRLLQEYAWPYNYTQLGRVLSELALMTNASYIQARDVRALLERENPAEGTANAVQKGAGGYTLDLSRPLSDITMDIIRLVLEENDGNQSAAAKQLNIGRSTLWRYLTRSTD
jgi:DNA-binding NtrC family response regulator